MPTCKYCFLYNQEKLESVCCFFQDRHSVVLFLSNVILSIQDLWTKFCKCDGENISIPCQIINNKYCYRHNDWFTGDNVSYELEFCLTSHEQQKIKEIIDTDFKIVL